MHPGEGFIQAVFEDHQYEWNEKISTQENVAAYNAEESFLLGLEVPYLIRYDGKGWRINAEPFHVHGGFNTDSIQASGSILAIALADFTQQLKEAHRHAMEQYHLQEMVENY